MQNAQTIYALASASGKSGVAVFRVSGPDALQALHFLDVSIPEARHATLASLKRDGTLIDQAIVLSFPAPHSFTGEDVIEFHTHGSRAVTSMLLEALSKVPGLRMAEPGEFARRAFLNGKLDLAQAEGLADMIDAETSAQHRQAMRQLGGDSSARITALREQILTPLALMEAYIDFPDEEIPEAVLGETQERLTALTVEIADLLNDGGVGEKIREGLEIVIIGPPNAGKSSLLNALAKREAAIVSEEAGTTRDLIEIHMEIAGYAATLVDTAGLREAAGTIEAEGIRRALARSEHADIKLLVADIVTIEKSMSELQALIDENTIVVANKSDLSPVPKNLPFPVIEISAKAALGLDLLVSELQKKINTRMQSVASPLITRARHREALNEALHHLNRFGPHLPLELNCEELRLASHAVGKITGKIWVDDVLDLVFSRFCIGK